MPFKDLREKEKEHRRSYIVDTAEKLFFSKGYEGVSMNEIAKKVGLNKATLYFYFESKEALYLVVVLRAVRLLDTMIGEGVKNSSTALQKLNFLKGVYLMYASIYPDYHRVYCDLRSGKFSLNAGGGETEREIARLERDIIDITCSAMETCASEGLLPSDIKPVDAAVLTLIVAEGLANPGRGVREFAEGRGINPQHYPHELSNLYIEMLRGKCK